MSKFKLACQTITWGDGQDEKFPEIFTKIASFGYSGIEAGWRRVENVKPESLKTMLEENNLKLSGLHIGGNIESRGQAEGEWGLLDRVIEYLHTLDCGYLLFSGLKYDDDAQFKNDLAMLDRSASRCKASGIKLLYHNHNWEFDNGHRILNALLELEDIGFCPDIGWVYKGVNGGDIIPVLESMKDRIGTIHFKDMATATPELDPVELGCGEVPLAEAAEWVKNNLPQDIWVTAEQDITAIQPEASAAINADFFKRQFS